MAIWCCVVACRLREKYTKSVLVCLFCFIWFRVHKILLFDDFVHAHAEMTTVVCMHRLCAYVKSRNGNVDSFTVCEKRVDK